jgi:hypothetical protein
VNAEQKPLGPVSLPKARSEGGGIGGHVQCAGSGKHAVGVCDDGEDPGAGVERQAEALNAQEHSAFALRLQHGRRRMG